MHAVFQHNSSQRILLGDGLRSRRTSLSVMELPHLVITMPDCSKESRREMKHEWIANHQVQWGIYYTPVSSCSHSAVYNYLLMIE